LAGSWEQCPPDLVKFSLFDPLPMKTLRLSQLTVSPAK
jgi:hypothetical protein